MDPDVADAPIWRLVGDKDGATGDAEDFFRPLERDIDCSLAMLGRFNGTLCFSWVGDNALVPPVSALSSSATCGLCI